MSSTNRFPMDRMDGLNLGLTVGVGVMLLLMIGGLVAGGLVSAAAGIGAGALGGGSAQALPGILAGVFGALVPLLIGVFTALIIASVWLLFRPSWFELSPVGLRIRWPLRRTFLPLSCIQRVEMLTAEERTARYGFGMRIGAGGMWGGFGYRTSNQGLLHMYISRLDYAVMIQVEGDKPWMITPRDPQRFVSTLEQLLERGE